MHTFAAIDIGSNSCRLKIGRVVQHRLRVVHEDREVTRLGASVFDSGIVSPEAMAATLRTLKRFYKAVQMHGTDKVRCVATSAMRDARNSRAFQAWVRDETGWDVEIISGLEEGRLIHRGVVENEPGAGGRCVLVDIGGGSCEITLSEHKRIHETISLPLGAVRLTQEFVRSEVPGKDEIRRLRQFIDREIRRATRRVHPERVRLVIGTSGTAAALFEAGRALGKGRASKDLVPNANRAAADGEAHEDEDGRALRGARGSGRSVRKSSSPARMFWRRCWRPSRCRGFAIRRWGCATAFLRRYWPSRIREPRRTGSSSWIAAVRSRRHAEGMESIRGKPSRCGSTRRRCFAIWRRYTICLRSIRPGWRLRRCCAISGSS